MLAMAGIVEAVVFELVYVEWHGSIKRNNSVIIDQQMANASSGRQ